MTDIEAEAARVRAAGECRPRFARDPVNLPTVHTWAEAIGDANPVYTNAELAEQSIHKGLVAPPAMAQVWTMYGLGGQRSDDDPLGAMMNLLDAAGYTSVVATNTEQNYFRYLRPGEQVSVTSRLGDVVGPKRTGLGEGWFVTTHSTWYVDDEPVADMLFRVLKFKPRERVESKPEPASAIGDVIRPQINRDSEYFWAGTRIGELRIQRCGQCGLLRHPPGPMCPECGATKRTHLRSEGVGEVFSYVVHHHPPVPGHTPPFVVALVELDEGVRMLGELTGIDPSEVHIGLPVRVAFTKIDDELTIPTWEPR